MPDFEQLTAKITEYIETTSVSAFALGVVQGHDLVYARGFGRIRRDELKSEVSPDTAFPSCSTAKPITATVVMKLVEQGLLELDSPVVEHLPQLKYPRGGDASRVTLRHLLSHTSGLSSDSDVPDRFFTARPECLEDHVRHDIPEYKAAGPPGKVFWYSNSGFNIVGHLAERRTGIPFSELVKEIVLAPASMTATSFDPSFTTARSEVEVLHADRSRYPPIPYPAGGAVTTIRDLANFAISHMHGGVLPRSRLLNEGTIDLMQSIHADAYSRPPRWYGLGFDIERHKGRKLVTHGGGGFGCGSTFVMVPDEKVAVIALFNHPGGYGVRARDILDQILNPRSTLEQERNLPDRDQWPTYAGRYQSAWPGFEGYPDEITITDSKDSIQMVVNGGTFPLVNYDAPVYQTEDGKVSVGFVPEGQYLMYDSYGIGLVSAWPYRKAH